MLPIVSLRGWSWSNGSGGGRDRGWSGACMGQKITAIRYNYVICSGSDCGNACFSLSLI